MFKIGHSKDVHRFVEGRKLILGGIEIPYKMGLLGHSDADCLLHAITEAIIGALGFGDIGTFFPDNDPKYKDISSRYFLEEAAKMLEMNNFAICNIDSTIYLEEPMIKPFSHLMKTNIANILKIDESLVNIKATRGEGLGYIGRKEGVAAEAVVLIQSTQKIKKL